MTVATFDLLITGVHLATMTGGEPYGVIRDAALGIDDGRISWLGPVRALPRDVLAMRTLEGGGRWLTPGLIDCHNHLVYAGNRAGEFDAQLKGASPEEIVKAGGGIKATVNATRAATEADLVRQGRQRLVALAAEGVTTIEIKSGYGLDTATECKQLHAARRLAAEGRVDVRMTLLAAHALPQDFAGHANEYIDYVCRDTIPSVAAAGLADSVDACCETSAFTTKQTRRVFAAAREHGLRIKLHADQLSDFGGAALAAEFDALSADHLEHANDAGIAAMARSGTVAVLLPGAFYALRETHPPPIASLRKHGVAMAIATDCNPGTAPVTSLLLMLNMACTLFRLTPEEALAGVTRHAARALGLDDRGTLVVGQRADLALWDIGAPEELSYLIGGNPCAGIVRAGSVMRWFVG